MFHILVVEDDVALSNGIVLALKDDSHRFTQAFDLAAAENALRDEGADLLILDVNLPDGSGLSFLSQLRKTSSVPVILLTARDMETDVVAGLTMGADDYITKPFSLMILRARVAACLRRQKPDLGGAVIIDDFSFAFDTMEFSKNGVPLELSKTEQKLLRLLVENRGNTLPRGLLVDKIWTDGAAYVDENALSVTIKRLRGKLEEKPSEPRYIKTVYGIGYTWAVKS